MTDLRYPLAWPLWQTRTPAYRRERSPFHRQGSSGQRLPLTTENATARVFRALKGYTTRRVPLSSIRISTNLELRKDGLPRSNQRRPDDPGAAVYFDLDGKPYCMACDAWATVEENLAAIAASLDDMRAIERHKTGSAEQQYAGFAAIPEKASESSAAKPRWFEALGFAGPVFVTEDTLKAAFRERTKTAHPDTPTGSHAAFLALQQAYEEGLAYLRERAP